MASNAAIFITLSLVNSICISFAFDTRPLLDFCVAVADPTPKSACKDPKTVTANDFFLRGLDRPGNTSNPYGAATVASADTVPGFNTLGLTFGRADLGPNGYVPPHIHPRASEVVYVVEGAAEIGFVTSYPQYKHYTKTLKAGDIFIIPVGLLHHVRNVANTNCVIMAALNSQNPGFVFIPDNVFAAKPAIDSGYLAAAFKLDVETVKILQTRSYFKSCTE